MYRICDATKGEITEFKENLPMIAVLCNQGMRERHWVKMSEVCGMSIQPDATTTLRGILDLKLEQYLEQFEVSM